MRTPPRQLVQGNVERIMAQTFNNAKINIEKPPFNTQKETQQSNNQKAESGILEPGFLTKRNWSDRESGTLAAGDAKQPSSS